VAFAVVADVTKDSYASAATHDVTMPATVNSGELLLMFYVCKQFGSSMVAPSGWTELAKAVGASGGHLLCYKEAAGTEGGGTATVTASDTSAACSQVYRLQGWNDVEEEHSSLTISSSPNPPSNTPSWGAKDTLWLAGATFVDDDGTVSAYSSNYSNGEYNNAGAGTNASSSIGIARRELNTTVQNPATMTLSEAEGWVAWTVAVEPGTKGEAGSDTDISGTLESITLTENAATTALDISVTAALESLLLSELQSSVAVDIALSGALESIQVSENPSNIAVDVSITGTQEQIELTENPASLGLGVSASAEQITLSEFVAGVSLDRSISGTLETIQVVENAASVATGLNATTESIVLTENQSTVQLDTAITTNLETIVLNELAAQVDLGANISASLESVTLTESGATIIFDSGISATLESISLSTLRATITSSTLAPTVPGLEYTMSGDRLHYTLPVNRLHFTFNREN